MVFNGIEGIHEMISIKEEKGAAGLEFTLVFPFLLFVTFGIIEFGALMFDKAIITNAAREGVRAAITYTYEGGGDPTCGEIATIQGIAQTAVIEYLENEQGNPIPINFNENERRVQLEDITANITSITIDETDEYMLNVQITYDYHFLFIDSIVNFLFNGAAGNPLQMIAEAEMRGEDNYRINDDTTIPLLEFLGSNCT